MPDARFAAGTGLEVNFMHLTKHRGFAAVALINCVAGPLSADEIQDARAGGNSKPAAVASERTVSDSSFALIGTVRSKKEGPMEGVIVTATKQGSTVLTAVTTDSSGRFAFPRDHLSAGDYAIAIRAIGYEWSNTDQGKTIAVRDTTPTFRPEDDGVASQQEYGSIDSNRGARLTALLIPDGAAKAACGCAACSPRGGTVCRPMEVRRKSLAPEAERLARLPAGRRRGPAFDEMKPCRESDIDQIGE